jgi:hypothetical protein
MRLALSVLVLACLTARAGAAPERPWARGVAEGEQAQALALFREGNVFFEQSRYSQALDKYKQAVIHWDHPAIRFNMAVSLINLDLPLEARDSLDKALAYGAAPFDAADLYAQGLTYRKLLDGRLAVLVVACSEPGARVSLDGKELLRAPGEARRVLLPGEHQIVAGKDGFLTSTRPLMLLPGREHREDVKLASVAGATRYEHRWAVWKPWLLAGAGAAVALVGLGLELQSSHDYDQYTSDVARLCKNSPTGGCTMNQLPGATRDLPPRAYAENVSAIVSFAVGGAALASGLVLVILNRARPILRREEPSPRVTVAPALGWLSAGAVVRF